MSSIPLTFEQREVLRLIGQAGGRKSRRTLTPDDLAKMQAARRAKQEARAKEVAPCSNS